MARLPLALLLAALSASAQSPAPSEPVVTFEALQRARVLDVFDDAPAFTPVSFGIQAAGAGLPVAGLRPGAMAYASADLAAIAALRDSVRASRVYEYGGAVLETGGRFYATTPVTNNDTDRVRYRVSVPKGFRLAGIYHTHPGGSIEGHLFSPNDVRQAGAIPATSYLGVMDDRTIRRFIPGRTPTSRLPDGSRGKVSSGVVIARGF